MLTWVESKIFRKRWRYIELFFVRVYWEIPVFIMFWIKFCTMIKHSSVTGVFWSVNNWFWPWLCTTYLASYLLTKWQFWQLTLKWLSGARTQDKTKEFFSCFFFLFFQDFIQLCDSRKIHYLTREFRVKLHLKTDIALIISVFACNLTRNSLLW